MDINEAPAAEPQLAEPPVQPENIAAPFVQQGAVAEQEAPVTGAPAAQEPEKEPTQYEDATEHVESGDAAEGGTQEGAEQNADVAAPTLQATDQEAQPAAEPAKGAIAAPVDVAIQNAPPATELAPASQPAEQPPGAPENGNSIPEAAEAVPVQAADEDKYPENPANKSKDEMTAILEEANTALKGEDKQGFITAIKKAEYPLGCNKCRQSTSGCGSCRRKAYNNLQIFVLGADAVKAQLAAAAAAAQQRSAQKGAGTATTPAVAPATGPSSAEHRRKSAVSTEGGSDKKPKGSGRGRRSSAGESPAGPAPANQEEGKALLQRLRDAWKASDREAIVACLRQGCQPLGCASCRHAKIGCARCRLRGTENLEKLYGGGDAGLTIEAAAPAVAEEAKVDEAAPAVAKSPAKRAKKADLTSPVVEAKPGRRSSAASTKATPKAAAAEPVSEKRRGRPPKSATGTPAEPPKRGSSVKATRVSSAAKPSPVRPRSAAKETKLESAGKPPKLESMAKQPRVKGPASPKETVTRPASITRGTPALHTTALRMPMDELKSHVRKIEAAERKGDRDKYIEAIKEAGGVIGCGKCRMSTLGCKDCRARAHKQLRALLAEVKEGGGSAGPSSPVASPKRQRESSAAEVAEEAGPSGSGEQPKKRGRPAKAASAATPELAEPVASPALPHKKRGKLSAADVAGVAPGQGRKRSAEEAAPEAGEPAENGAAGPSKRAKVNIGGDVAVAKYRALIAAAGALQESLTLAEMAFASSDTSSLGEALKMTGRKFKTLEDLRAATLEANAAAAKAAVEWR